MYFKEFSKNENRNKSSENFLTHESVTKAELRFYKILISWNMKMCI